MYTRGDREKLLAWEVPSISISLALLEAFCSPRCWNPPGRDAARSAQDLIPSPLGVISKLMAGWIKSTDCSWMKESQLLYIRNKKYLWPY